MQFSLGSARGQDANVNKITRKHDELERPDRRALALDVLGGFSRSPKCLPSRWFYDETGSRLFCEITRLSEYYLTSREADILETHAADFMELATSGPLTIVELGAGEGTKTEILLRELARRSATFTYQPIDISTDALEGLCRRLLRSWPDLRIKPRVGDNQAALARISSQRGRNERLCVLYLGSSIGNCERSEVDGHLRDICSCLRAGDFLLIGFDLLKSSDRLCAAYSDSSGVTAQFNLNLLARLNRELGANFDLRSFAHEATWNPWILGMESWLVSLREQTVTIRELDASFTFSKWERIRTEVSLKFAPQALPILASETGFEVAAHFEDDDQDFSDHLWRAIDRER